MLALERHLVEAGPQEGHPQGLEAGFPVYPVNPKTVDRHRKASGAKTDAIDAIFWPAQGGATWPTCAASGRLEALLDG